MPAQTEVHAGASSRSWRGPLRVAALAAAAAVLAVLPAAATADPRPTTFVISAKSGQLGGGKLRLSGVKRNLAWISHGQGTRSGMVSMGRLHDRLFSRYAPRGFPGANKTAVPTALLQVEGRSNIGLRLSQPRYNPSRRMATYSVKQLGKRSGAAGFRMREFGAASLSIVSLGAPLDRYQCNTSVNNYTNYTIQAVGESKWDTDSWNPGIPDGQILFPGGNNVYGSEGGVFRGCGNGSVWQIMDGGPGIQGVQFTFSSTIPYGGENPGNTQGNCTSSSPAFVCMFNQGTQNTWLLEPARSR